MHFIFVKITDRFFCLAGPKLAFTVTGADFVPLLVGETRVQRRLDAEETFCPMVEIAFHLNHQSNPTDFVLKGVIPRADDFNFSLEIWDQTEKQVAKSFVSAGFRKIALKRSDNQSPIGDMIGPLLGYNRQLVKSGKDIGSIRKIPFWSETAALREPRKLFGASCIYGVEFSSDEDVFLWIVAWALMVCARHSIISPKQYCGCG